MSDKMKSLAMLDVAELLLRESTKPLTIQEIIKSVAEIKETSLDDIDRMTQLYMDITQSAKFVYCGDDQWDLKERNLELWDKDGFAFVHAEEVEEDVEEDLDFTEFVLEDEEEVVKDDEEDEEEVDEEIKEEKAYIEIDLPIKSTDDDVDDEPEIEFDDDYDEDDYNEIMDDYEDMYDE
ncbi:MAG: DNA-directed RNA polymerase subunit delta [Acholeplasmataceae bacterium]|nr:DNA-directed RNA polymerase subunit delta [Acholeplasmataceae bacterium]